MNRGIFVSAHGMLSAQRMLDVVANNLANGSTTGFKRDVLAFGDTLMQQIRVGENDAVAGSIGTGPNQPIELTSFEQGPITPTGNPLDLAIRQMTKADPRDPSRSTPVTGMFAVMTPQGVRYTRNGSFQTDPTGRLVNADGYAVLDNRLNPIQIPSGEMQVEPTGEISVKDASGTMQSAGEIGVFEGDFTKRNGSLYDGANTKPVEAPDVAWKALEGSNVNPIAEMVEMISLGRAFEMAQKSIQSQDEMAQKLIQVLQDR